MKEFFFELLSNEILVIGISSWAIAQVFKFLINLLIHKKFDFSRLIGDGGMPSAHSATVSSMAMISFFIYGVGSFEFAITFMVAIIVMHDAMGVRLETGKQAKVIKEITSIIEDSINLATNFSDDKLKELVGHTPLQVFFGAILGIIIANVSYFYIF